MDGIRYAVDQLHKNLINQLEDSFIEGLKRKGFQFDTKMELEHFVKARCRCEDNLELKERVYFVDDTPFFLHNYKSEIITDPTITGETYKIVGELGSFLYL
jgi:hypothetical protein